MQRFLGSRAVLVVCAVLMLAAIAVAFAPIDACCKRKAQTEKTTLMKRIAGRGKGIKLPPGQECRMPKDMSLLRYKAMKIISMFAGPTMPPIDECWCEGVGCGHYEGS
jgi:hypothetical protein